MFNIIRKIKDVINTRRGLYDFDGDYDEETYDPDEED